MTDDSQPQSGGSRRRFSLEPAYKQDNPNPHAHSRGMGRSPLPTPATLAGRVWNRLGVSSHIALTVLLLPLAAFVIYLYSTGTEAHWLAVFVGTIALSYGIYYSRAPRESNHVIARLENLYHAKRFAFVSSGIAVMSVLSTIALIFALNSELYFPVKVSDTSVTIATIGMAIGLLSSYILVHVLTARALPVKSNEPIIDRLVGVGTAVEVAFILAAIGAPLYIAAAQFIWDQPALYTIDFTISRNAASLLLAGFIALYTALITRM